jgi:hypothetical protein
LPDCACGKRFPLPLPSRLASGNTRRQRDREKLPHWRGGADIVMIISYFSYTGVGFHYVCASPFSKTNGGGT